MLNSRHNFCNNNNYKLCNIDLPPSTYNELERFALPPHPPLSVLCN